MIFVRKLIWDAGKVKHIARHNVIPDEVEAVCHGSPFVHQGQQKSRLVLIGPTEEERMLTIVLKNQGHGVYYLITAYPTTKQDITLYKRLQGGKK